jgi:hypothetical protein
MNRGPALAHLSAGVAAAVMACAQPASESNNRLAAEADFVFNGTDLAPRAATIDATDVSDLAIVRVDEVVAGSDPFKALAGRTVTLRLKDPALARAGERRVYYTKGWHWGDEIGLIELGSTEIPGSLQIQTMRNDIATAKQQLADQQLAERIRTAPLVISGTVRAVRNSNIPRGATEHDPEWREADISVASVIKGDSASKLVTILFPGSDDVMWKDAPKFREGMDGIWILHPYVFDRPLPHLTALLPIDFLARADEPRVRRLMAK